MIKLQLSTKRLRMLEKNSCLKEAFAMNLIPTVIEQTNRGERAYDIYSRLIKRPYHYAWKWN